MAYTPLANGATFGVQRAALNSQLAELYGGALNINAQTASYTLLATDVGKQIDMNSASPNVLTVPTNATAAIPVGTVIPVCQIGTGATSIAAASGVTFQISPSRSLTISSRYEKAYLEKIATDTWRVYPN